jgi:hypothetical protein
MQVPSRVDRISLEVRQIHLGRILLAGLLGLLYGVGFGAAALLRAVLLALGALLYAIAYGAATAVSWSGAALKVGWTDGWARTRSR